MSSAAIIGGGDFPKKEYPRELIRRSDRIVCCDGHALAAFMRNRGKLFPGTNRLPDAVVGDMDSMTERQKRDFQGILVQVQEQDDNDQTKAFNFILSEYPEVDTIHIVAATGKRECHTIGNLGLLMEYARRTGACGIPQDSGVYVDMVSDYSTAFAITGSCEFFVGEGRQVSLYSPDNSLSIRSSGLAWQTAGVVFDNWWPASLNRATSDLVRLTFSHPSTALVILD